MPASIEAKARTLTIGEGAGIVAGDAGAKTAAKLLAQQVKVVRGLSLASDASTGPIRFVRDASVTGDEAYVLSVDAKGVTIAASGDAGLVHGAMTLAQLLSPDAEVGKPVVLAAMTIRDAPRFKWRGLMIDPARHFVPMPTLCAMVDQLAAQKMNVLHLHLTDDQGWRVEIKRYPEPDPDRRVAHAAVGGWCARREGRRILYAGRGSRRWSPMPRTARSRWCPRSTCPAMRRRRSRPIPPKSVCSAIGPRSVTTGA
ncbi:family 20 glycosylhydrolase [Sphingomonas aurantiaca]|uniref:family 20 glycosylhydrolase n=1 Tax=Sphingomonas aurantiaca TaxID=185949 RepID=UPI002FE0EC34